MNRGTNGSATEMRGVLGKVPTVTGEMSIEIKVREGTTIICNQTTVANQIHTITKTRSLQPQPELKHYLKCQDMTPFLMYRSILLDPSKKCQETMQSSSYLPKTV